MNEKPAGIKPYEKNSSGARLTVDCQSSWTNVAQDDVYERRIFELESRINHLEHLLMMAELERNRYKRQVCA